MDVYMEVTFDQLARVGQGEVLARWFREAQTRFFSVIADSETTDKGEIFSRASVAADMDGPSLRVGQVGKNWKKFEVQLTPFPWWADLDYVTGDVTLGWARSVQSTYEGYCNAVVGLLLGAEKRANGTYCATLVEFLRVALDEVNPAFGRIEQDLSFERANLDIALHRRLRRSLRESRDHLRGYAWVTVCPQELIERLGGCEALVASNAFYRVISLLAGGALLQASETLPGYSDEVMQKVFEALAPVLPAGAPQPDPAHPHARFVAQDAGLLR
ncbi:DUF3396 domain-containing protein [Streptomyces sp. SID12501]|uniref:DUF3396 domain-containing protein n=1 Tax=Streptomyces sp. SID12501 TaxID=2706042 RepID=A0A6B3BQ85_9ACTN|nr:DUF3396 domain-containing protein [Streptomyces sp. SID12501]NEC86478.1 DUF3396 domain-containing protein [Streptomyces sp. SID12501]